MPQAWLSPEAYLAQDREAPDKSEYIDGVTYAMGGASESHNLVTANLIALLWAAVRVGGPGGGALAPPGTVKPGACRVYPSGLRVRTPSGRYFYPDVSVICGETRFADDQQDIVLNPTVVIEVLSDSTALRDRGPKFLGYQGIPSLQEYLLVAQDQAAVEQYRRQPGNTWLYTRVEGLEASLAFPSLGCSLALSDIYLNAL